MKSGQALRDHVLYLLNGDGAHLDFATVAKDVLVSARGKRPKGGPHSPWELLEHLRITQEDVLQSTRDPKHASPEFPAGYWPSSATPPSEKSWEQSATAFQADLRALSELAKNASMDLLGPLPSGDGQTILRKLLMIADHNSYHIGQLLLVKQLLQ
jgi:DinB superfamily